MLDAQVRARAVLNPNQTHTNQKPPERACVGISGRATVTVRKFRELTQHIAPIESGAPPPGGVPSNSPD